MLVQGLSYLHPKTGSWRDFIYLKFNFVLNVYINELLLQLHDSKISCFFGEEYLLTLVMLMIYYVPVLLAYKKTLNLCAEYALE